jgi:ABC-type sugar transport system ATPase subunit
MVLLQPWITGQIILLNSGSLIYVAAKEIWLLHNNFRWVKRMKEIILKCENISKSFPGVKALDKVRFDLRKGEVHALCGENGAGKSTLIKIVSGLFSKDEGTIEHFGNKVKYKNAIECRKNGIALIPQELHLAQTLTVAENVFMTKYPKKKGLVDWKKMYKDTRKLQERLGKAALTFEPDQLVSKLNMGQQQLVEIMKAISTDVNIIAFDEPTSSLSDEETAEMFALIKQLTKQGISIIYVSHRLSEIFEICQRVSVFKDGKYVGTKDTDKIETKDIIAMMVGRDMQLYEKHRGRSFGDKVLEVEGLRWGKKVNGVSFNLRKGEILGMFGIVGAGRTETARLIFGLEEKDAGVIKVNGKEVAIKHPKDAVALKLGFLTEDRRGEGLAVVLNVTENTTMPSLKRFIKNGIIRIKKEESFAQEMANMLNTKTPSMRTKVATLSGGNQQKIAIAKWLGAKSDILIFDEPTRGIDVGAKAEIYKLMDELTGDGKSIVMISSELPEILAMSDRLLVLRDGKIAAELNSVEKLCEEDVVCHAIKT